jgi:hypothetical protein
MQSPRSCDLTMFFLGGPRMGGRNTLDGASVRVRLGHRVGSPRWWRCSKLAPRAQSTGCRGGRSRRRRVARPFLSRRCGHGLLGRNLSGASHHRVLQFQTVLARQQTVVGARRARGPASRSRCDVHLGMRRPPTSRSRSRGRPVPGRCLQPVLRPGSRVQRR